MALNVGERLGHYQVTALIGEGGMGQVYRATDTKLNRQVALKILPEAFASDPDRLARFQREAQVLASLNHPGIAAIHGIEESDGQQALVLELVEGPTLADRIARGTIPLDEALPIAKQIAEALEAAHEAGVIHRDLKPANIKVRDDGTVKVLDFGIAKALGSIQEGDQSQSPTITAMATATGVIIGTAAYMAPEQAKGKSVDRRADVWAFGVVLFEMLSGKRPFGGGDIPDTLARILEREPDYSSLPSRTPASIRRLLRRCLAKDGSRRLPDIGAARLEIEEAQLGDVPEERARPSRRPALVWVLGAGLVVAMATAVSLLTSGSREPGAATSRFNLDVPDGTQPTSFAISPDGRTIAFVDVQEATGQVYLRDLNALEATVLPAAEGSRPQSFSLDGRSLLVHEAVTSPPRALKRVELSGGSATIVAANINWGADWGEDGQLVHGSEPAGPLWLVSPSGTRTRLTTLSDGEIAHVAPRWVENGRAVLYHIQYKPGRNWDTAVYDVEQGTQRTLLPGAWPRLLTSGHLVFWRNLALWAAPFDRDRLEVLGSPVRVVEAVAAGYAVSPDGLLVYRRVTDTPVSRTLVWVSRDGTEEPLGAPPRPYGPLHLSPDGQRLAVTVLDPGNVEIWVHDLLRNVQSPLTVNAAQDYQPRWTPDGRRIVFSSTRGGAEGKLYWQAADGTDRAERIVASAYQEGAYGFTPDGSRLLFGFGHPVSNVDIGLVTIGGEGDVTMLLETEFQDTHAALSPDGRWLAYTSNESGQRQVYVRPFPNVTEGRWLVSQGEGVSPVWGPDSRELFYQAQAERGGPVALMLVTNTTDPEFVPGIPRVVFEGPYRYGVGDSHRVYDVAPDGTRFLMVREVPSDRPQVVLVQNWHEELKRLVPTP